MAIKTNQVTDKLSPSSGTLRVGATGAIEIPTGNTVQRPVSPAAGAIRFDSDSSKLDVFDGATWNALVALSYVDSTASNLQTQINNIISNIDPATLDSLSEIVTAFQSGDSTLLSAITANQTSLTTVQSGLAQEISNRQFADTLATNARAAEVTNRIAGHNVLQGNIDAEEIDRIAQDNQLAVDIAQETSDRQTAISTLDTAITNEETARISADSVHDSNITLVDGKVNTEIVDRSNADIILQNNIDAEETARIAAINLEVLNRGNADTTLQNNIDAEALTRLMNDNALQTSLDTEILARQNAISNLAIGDLTDVQNTSPTDGQLFAYDGILSKYRPQTIALVPITKNYVGDGTTLQFSLGTDVPSPNNLVVVVDGVAQKPLYSYVVTNSDQLVFDEAPESGSVIEVRILLGHTTTDRPRPKISNISYSVTTAPVFNLIIFNVTEMAYGFGAKIGNIPIAHIEYPSANQMQLKTAETFTGNQSITLIDNSGNEFVFEDAFAEPDGTANPLWTDATKFIGTFSSGDTINFPIGVNTGSTLTLGATSQNEATPTWLSASGLTLVGTAPTLSSPCRYEFQIIATIGLTSISRNYWLVVI
jgi:hypothetical protein